MKFFKEIIYGPKRDPRFKECDREIFSFIGWDKKTQEILIEHSNGVQNVFKRVLRLDSTTRGDSVKPPRIDSIEEIEVLEK